MTNKRQYTPPKTAQSVMIILKLNDSEEIYFPPELGKVSNFAFLISFAKTREHLFINLKIYDTAFDMLTP